MKRLYDGPGQRIASGCSRFPAFLPLGMEHLCRPLHRLIGAGDCHSGAATGAHPVLVGKDRADAKEPRIDDPACCIQRPKAVIDFDAAPVHSMPPPVQIVEPKPVFAGLRLVDKQTQERFDNGDSLGLEAAAHEPAGGKDRCVGVDDDGAEIVTEFEGNLIFAQLEAIDFLMRYQSDDRFEAAALQTFPSSGCRERRAAWWGSRTPVGRQAG